MKNRELSHAKWNFNRLQIIIGITALALGVILYLYDRPSSQVYFVSELFSQYKGERFVFGKFGYHLPTFLHAFAFCLITTGILASGIRQALIICLFWLFIDGSFEVAQHPDIANKIITYIPDWFKSIPVLENTADYFIQGRYDPADLAAILIGITVAYILILFLHMKIKAETSVNGR